jgi:hypothetical protein
MIAIGTTPTREQQVVAGKGSHRDSTLCTQERAMGTCGRLKAVDVWSPGSTLRALPTEGATGVWLAPPVVEGCANTMEPAHQRHGARNSAGKAFPPSQSYLVLRDTLCSCEAYGMRPMYRKKPHAAFGRRQEVRLVGSIKKHPSAQHAICRRIIIAVTETHALVPHLCPPSA